MFINSLNELPYINPLSTELLFGRKMILTPFYHDEKWHVPMLAENERILLIPGIPHKGPYVAQTNQNEETDFHFTFINLIYKYSSWDEILPHVRAIISDIFYLFTSVAKIDLFQKIPDSTSDVADYVTSELEYILINCKSLFDYLQKVLSLIWNNHVRLLTGIKINLPKTFRRMIFTDKKRFSKEEIQTKYNLPFAIAEAYYTSAEFYENLKKLRDDIVHHGKEIDIIFNIKKCFGSSIDGPLLKAFPIFKNDECIQNNIYSIRPLIHYLIKNTTESCDGIVTALMTNIKFSESIFKEYEVFLRVPHHVAYRRMDIELKTSSFWE